MTELDERTKEIPSEILSIKKLQVASETLYATSLNPEEKNLYDQAEDRIMTEMWVIEESFVEGFTKGRAEGKKNKTINMAKMMLTDNEPMEKIIKYTELTIDEIKQIQTI